VLGRENGVLSITVRETRRDNQEWTIQKASI